MDTFEEYYVTPETSQQTNPSGKRSPFADSPYECAYIQSPEQPRKSVRKRTPGKGRRLVAVLCVLALVIGCCAATGFVVSNSYQDRLNQMEQATQQSLAQMEQRLAAAEKNNSQSWVSADTEGLTPGQIYSQNVDAVVCVYAYGEIPGVGGMDSVGSSGSGFVYSSDGYVVTNYHVVEGMTELYVELEDKTELPAELVGYEASADVAVLKVDRDGLPSVKLGSSDAIRVGDQVVAIGYPLDSQTASLTVGYVSAKDQIVDTEGTESTMLQTDAAINSGNSGGPLFNAVGEVIGITTAKFSGYSSSGVSIEGMSFAIPMDDIIGIIEDLKEYGYVTGAYLGVYVLDVNEAVQMYGLPVGAFVEEAIEGLAAQQGGILAGDVIIKVDQYEITSVAGLTNVLRRYEAGDTVKVTVWRNGQEVQLSVTLSERPVEQPEQPPQTQPTPEMPQEEEFQDWDSWFYDEFFDFFSEFAD